MLQDEHGWHKSREKYIYGDSILVNDISCAIIHLKIAN